MICLVTVTQENHTVLNGMNMESHFANATNGRHSASDERDLTSTSFIQQDEVNKSVMRV